MSKNELAQAVVQRLTELECELIELLGIELVEIAPNRCVTKLKVRDDLANSGRVAQGGILFALADQAMAYACMSNNTVGMTLSANITFTRPAQIGDTLTATAVVSFDGGGRTLTGRAEIVNQRGITIAEVTGIWLRSREKVVNE